MSKKKNGEKVRTVMLFIDGDEVKRICDENLGGITFKAEIRHSRVDLTAWTGEEEKIKATQT